MEHRQLGGSGLYVPALCLGTATFGGTNGFEGWGHTKVEEATRMVNLCLDAGVNLFDTADVYSNGLSEEILGKAIHGLRNRLLISTKATFNLSPLSARMAASISSGKMLSENTFMSLITPPDNVKLTSAYPQENLLYL